MAYSGKFGINKKKVKHGSFCFSANFALQLFLLNLIFK